MYVVGHLSVAYLTGRACQLRRDFDDPPVTFGLYLCIVGGALFPDLVDKPHMYLGWSIFSRTWSHSFLVFGVVGLLWLVVRAFGARRARPLGWFVAGWATHFAADFLNDLVAGVWYTGYLWSPWFLWPLVEPDDMYWEFGPVLMACRECYTYLELVVVGFALAVAALDRAGSG